MTMGNSGNEKPAKEKKELAIGTFGARTTQFFWTKFDNGSVDRRLLSIEVEFTEGPNVGLHGTAIISMDAMEFSLKTLMACGWVEGMVPTKIPTGVDVKAVVEKDTNPKTGVTKNIVKYINDTRGRPSMMAEKYGLAASESDAWDREFLASASHFVKTTGFAVPKAAAGQQRQQPQHGQTQTQRQQTQTQTQHGDGDGREVGGGDGDDIPFMRLADI